MTNVRNSCTLLLGAFLCLLLLPIPLTADDTAALKERLHAAVAESSLDMPDLKPWHLLLNFQLLNRDGKSDETGTIEEWWAAPNLHKTVYTSPSYNNTEVTNEQGSYKLFPNIYPPETLTLVLDQVVHPMPDQVEIDDSKPDLRKQEFAKIPLDCIMLDQKLVNLSFFPLGLFPTFCFDSNRTSLRIMLGGGSIFVGRNRIGTFQGKSVVTEEAASIDSVPVIKAHLETLTGAVFTPNDFLTTSNLTKLDDRPVAVGGTVMAGSVIHKVTPNYPDAARLKRASGTVVFHLYIGRDGRVHHLKLLSSPDPDLALAAFTAVRQWTYKPYLLNGQPVTVDTTITVNFSFGPG